ncbi:hypothetical protein SPRG_17977 [Saprolegnia parasitica CBS 223.65]|uniref:Uncharacterized protein n=1 Tax=Saprolegnia parasitica (strain CBS 223.65) TaxID=695850 RepID=A0A067BQA8_SAPPC|nr:hypothetical protein SPRG_17977 [Saprolegnia parasitica CBS 223.65]KDO16506.1 hypothetical protein SPRG_17977 [Saprolegnia parasitica CBS 223.65]|eukprot:XP_012212786.1 hypothetical protein SPRG_17977 [Saprolegnia parasitica CBS 223.65]
MPNTTFNATISYSTLNVSLVVTRSASSGLNYSLQSLRGVSLAPAGSPTHMDCAVRPPRCSQARAFAVSLQYSNLMDPREAHDVATMSMT